jgi:TfoX/Sxy family transcriptional regulator of competence genes
LVPATVPMHGKIPPPMAEAVGAFERLTPTKPTITVKKVFGQPAAFVNGNMFMGVFGAQVFVRLSEPECRSALEKDGLKPFEPMEGRAMRGYVVLNPKILASNPTARSWVARSLTFSEKLPPKTPKRKAR